MSEATHATVATFRLDLTRVDEQRQALRDRIVPSVRQHRGFINGTWMFDRETATSVVVINFASREAAGRYGRTSSATRWTRRPTDST